MTNAVPTAEHAADSLCACVRPCSRCLSNGNVPWYHTVDIQSLIHRPGIRLPGPVTRYSCRASAPHTKLGAALATSQSHARHYYTTHHKCRGQESSTEPATNTAIPSWKQLSGNSPETARKQLGNNPMPSLVPLWQHRRVMLDTTSTTHHKCRGQESSTEPATNTAIPSWKQLSGNSPETARKQLGNNPCQVWCRFGNIAESC